MGGAAFDALTPTLMKILIFFTFIRKNIKNLEFTAIRDMSRDREKNYYKSVIASFSGYWTIWSKPAAPGLIINNNN